jgi:hypothetical protein
MIVRAQAIFLVRQHKTYMSHSRGNDTLAGNNGTLMFEPVRERWRLKSCLLPTEGYTSPCYFVAAISVMEDVGKLICEVEKRPALCNKNTREYSDRNSKKKLWCEVWVSVVENWSELHAEEKTEKGK